MLRYPGDDSPYFDTHSFSLLPLNLGTIRGFCTFKINCATFDKSIVACSQHSEQNGMLQQPRVVIQGLFEEQRRHPKSHKSSDIYFGPEPVIDQIRSVGRRRRTKSK